MKSLLKSLFKSTILGYRQCLIGKLYIESIERKETMQHVRNVVLSAGLMSSVQVVGLLLALSTGRNLGTACGAWLSPSLRELKIDLLYILLLLLLLL